MSNTLDVYENGDVVRESWLVSNLVQCASYAFRVVAVNAIGRSQPSIPTPATFTLRKAVHVFLFGGVYGIF